MMKKSHRWFWGSFFLIGAVLVVMGQLGGLPAEFGFWRILFAIFMVAIVIYSLAHKGITGTVFGLAALAILFRRPLGITALGPWTIGGVALLVTIGLTLLLKPTHAISYHYHFDSGTEDDWEDSDERLGSTDRMTTDEDHVQVDVNMGDSIRYLQSQDFQQADVRVRMGNAKVYFDDVQMAADGAVVNLDVSLGGVTLYFPSDWNVKLAVESSLGGVDVKGKQPATDGPRVIVQGRVSLAGLTVVYL